MAGRLWFAIGRSHASNRLSPPSQWKTLYQKREKMILISLWLWAKHVKRNKGDITEISFVIFLFSLASLSCYLSLKCTCTHTLTDFQSQPDSQTAVILYVNVSTISLTLCSNRGINLWDKLNIPLSSLQRHMAIKQTWFTSKTSYVCVARGCY